MLLLFYKLGGVCLSLYPPDGLHLDRKMSLQLERKSVHTCLNLSTICCCFFVIPFVYCKCDHKDEKNVENMQEKNLFIETAATEIVYWGYN